MKDLFIDPSWTYKQTVNKIKELKLQYQEVLCSFSLWETKEWANFIRSTRNKFYALNCLEWQKDIMWNYMNGHIPFYVIKRSASRFK